MIRTFSFVKPFFLGVLKICQGC